MGRVTRLVWLAAGCAAGEPASAPRPTGALVVQTYLEASDCQVDAAGRPFLVLVRRVEDLEYVASEEVVPGETTTFEVVPEHYEVFGSSEDAGWGCSCSGSWEVEFAGLRPREVDVLAGQVITAPLGITCG